MNWLQHPNIWKFSATLVVLNLIAMGVCALHGAVNGIIVNGFFLLINTVAAIGNFQLRRYRATLLEEQKVERRNQLIRLTIGE